MSTWLRHTLVVFACALALLAGLAVGNATFTDNADADINHQAETLTPTPEPEPTPTSAAPIPTVAPEPDPTSAAPTAEPTKKPKKKKSKRGTVYLTFDDGPGVNTPEILDILDQYDIKAVFFENGVHFEGRQQIMQDIVDRGHIIGNHTWAHEDLKTISKKKQYETIESVQTGVEKAVGHTPRCFRPPYGNYNDETSSILKDLDLLLKLWNVDSEDWKKPGAKKIVKDVIAGVKSHGATDSIVLFHDGPSGREQTVEAVETIIPKLLDDGYTFKLMEHC